MQPEDQPTPAAALDALLNALEVARQRLSAATSEDSAASLKRWIVNQNMPPVVKPNAATAAAAYNYALAHNTWAAAAAAAAAAPTEAEHLASVTEYMEAKQARDSAWAAYCAAQTAYLDHIDSQSYQINRS